MIKMRVNTNTSSACDECGTKYKDTLEMYDLVLCGTQYTLCKDCVEVLFRKTLRADCMYNAKLKRPEDLKKAERIKARRRVQ